VEVVRRAGWLVLALGVTLALSGCAAAANDALVPRPAGPGFWLGLWHGLIAPVTFIVSLFDEHVGIYAVHNSGHLYDLGFLVGMSVIFSVLGGSAPAASRQRRSRS
jgi:hypothetical protein